MLQVRIDKWLWAVRVFKTRALAIEACRDGYVKTKGNKLKPSYKVKIGETFTIRQNPIIRTVKVVELLDRRVGPKLVEQYAEDLTPESEYKKREVANSGHHLTRERGAGRPTKKERRKIEEFLD